MSKDLSFIKSANIVLSMVFIPKLIDRGLSKFIPSTPHELGTIISSSNMALGTPGCMCPTYMRKCQYDGKSGIFSFRVVLFELLTGQLMVPNHKGHDLYKVYIEDEKPIVPDLDI